MNIEKPVLSIVLPCFNEVEAIPHVVSRLKDLKKECFKQNFFSDVEFIVVDDASTDASSEKLRSYDDIVYARHTTRLGYGAALKTGFAKTKGDFIAFMDMDFSYNPNDLLSMYKSMQEQNYDLVSGKRLHTDAKMPFMRVLGNIFYSKILKHAIGSPIDDVCTGFRIFPASLKQFFTEISEDKLNFSVAMTVKSIQSNLRLGEIPIQYHWRKGHSKLNIITDGVAFLFSIIKGIYGHAHHFNRHFNRR